MDEDEEQELSGEPTPLARARRGGVSPLAPPMNTWEAGWYAGLADGAAMKGTAIVVMALLLALPCVLAGFLLGWLLT